MDNSLSLLPSDPTDQLPHEVLPHPVGGRRRIPLHIQPHPLRHEQTAAGTEIVKIFILCSFVVCVIHVCVVINIIYVTLQW